jgi:hypothetical protein
MDQFYFPAMPLANWQPTRDTIHIYSKLLGKIRGTLTPHQRHWWHISLRVAANGLTTTAVPIPNTARATFEMLLDFQGHRLAITTSRGERWEQPLIGQSARTFYEMVLATLDKMGIQLDIDRSLFADATPGSYNHAAVETFWSALSKVDAVFKEFKAELGGETSPVQLWPHHFDLGLVWFSGRKVPGTDPADEEHSNEQINFGFSTGDEGIPNPYFYSSAYPWQEKFTEMSLPDGVSWHTEGWTGALLMYEQLVEAEDGEEKLWQYLRAVHEAWARFMTD